MELLLVTLSGVAVLISCVAVGAMVQTQAAIRESILAMNTALAHLPTNAAEEVKKGLTPLTVCLENTHNRFTDAMATVNRDGKLAEWVDGVRAVGEPLLKAANEVSQHYQANRELGGVVSLLLQQTSQHGTEANKSVAALADTVERWAVDENLHRQDMKSLIANRLEELAATDMKLADNLDQLKITTDHLAQSTKGLMSASATSSTAIDAFL
ncbi:MAG: hypothetical protein K2Q10_10010, partial [Rhodospirillales bacterium]|nr:hypothetical protein [Rhodospirillales bacterium]